MNSVNQKSDAKILSVLLLILLMMPASLFSQSGWYKLNSPTSSDLRAVCFKDALHGCVIGKDVLFITVNGGQSWVNIENIPVVGENDYFTFESLCYTNTTTGWIAGDLYVDPPGMHHKIILKTEDAGNSWLYSYCAESETGLSAICYKNPYVGFSVGGNSILRSGDMGVTWEQCYYPNNENDYFSFKSVCFINSLTGYIAGEVYSDPPGILSQVVFGTMNAGNNWIEVLRTPGTGWNSINFCSSNTGWVTGGGVIKGTTDGGQTWPLFATFGGHNNVYNLKHVYFPNQTIGFVSGGFFNTITLEHYNLILKTNDGGLSWNQQIFSTGRSDNYILNSIYFIDQLTGWAVGDGGIIMKTTDGGTTYIKPIESKVPESFILYQNYPNPFNPTTKIKFEIPSPVGWMRNADGVGLVTLKVYDILGKEVAILVNEKLQPGTYEVTFDGSKIPSGVYFYKLITNKFTDTKRMLLIK